MFDCFFFSKIAFDSGVFKFRGIEFQSFSSPVRKRTVLSLLILSKARFIGVSITAIREQIGEI